jgi:hypothetical protein
MNRVIYLDKKSFLKFDDTHYIVYLNEEVVDNYVPETTMENLPAPDPVTAYAYTGPEVDGGTLIEALSPDRDSLINGIIRSKYSQSEEDAIKTHQIICLTNPDNAKADDYAWEWKAFNAYRESAIATVDSWFNQ